MPTASGIASSDSSRYGLPNVIRPATQFRSTWTTAFTSAAAGPAWTARCSRPPRTVCAVVTAEASARDGGVSV